MIEKKCTQCGKSFMAHQSRAMYCSENCGEKFRRVKKGIQVAGSGRTRVCRWCKKTFPLTRANRWFCSRRCSIRFTTHHGFPFLARPCKHCGKTFMAEPIFKQYCSDKCSERAGDKTRRGLPPALAREDFLAKMAELDSL